MNAATLHNHKRPGRIIPVLAPFTILVSILIGWTDAKSATSPPVKISKTWAGDQINLPLALNLWNNTAKKSNRVVAVLDYGFISTNPELLGIRRWTNYSELNGTTGLDDDDANTQVDDYYGWDFLGDDNDPTDVPLMDGTDDIHGTRVAPIVGGRIVGTSKFEGVAPNAEVMLIRWAGKPDYRNFAHLADGINYAVSSGAHIVNFSASWQVDPDHPVDAIGIERVEDAIQNALNNDVILVVAVRNYPVHDVDDPSYYPHLAAMFTHENIICVTGIENEPLDGYVDLGQFGSNSVDIAAPARIHGPFRTSGDPIVGVSYSAAVMSGAAALVWGLMPELTAKEVRCLLLWNSKKLDATQVSPGRVWGESPPANKLGVLDLSFVENAHKAYLEYMAGNDFTSSCFGLDSPNNAHFQ